MYSNKLVACVKANGKVLREKGDEVYLPFGSEYSIYLKNEHSRKVQIEVSIDGQDVLAGKALLLNAGENMDLKGYVKDIYGKDNRAFKFITKTQEISDFRGDKPEDGLIKISYTFEKEKPIQTFRDIGDITFGGYNSRSYTNCGGNNDYPNSEPMLDSGYVGNINHSTLGNISNDISYSSNTVTNSIDDSFSTQTISSTAFRSVDLSAAIATAAVVSDEPGITVEGSATGQSFQRGHIGVLEDKSHTMVFQLKGLSEVEQIQEPITVKSKKQCPSCGKKYKSSFEYCPQDGTFLRLP